MSTNKNNLEKEDILNFWFKECTPEQWFKKDSEFDKMLEARFASTVERALSGKLDKWGDSDSGCLALIILLDQFTRNIFRDKPRAFEGDEKALELSFRCHENGYLANADVNWCHFMLMPRMHSEDIAVQNFSLPLFKKLNVQNVYDYALRHHAIVARFERFPHRNSILGRSSTHEELEFLTQADSSF